MNLDLEGREIDREVLERMLANYINSYSSIDNDRVLKAIEILASLINGRPVQTDD